jgi:hypothetical protein
LTAGDDRGGVVIRPRAVVVDGIKHDDAELRRRAVQAGERGGQPGRGHQIGSSLREGFGGPGWRCAPGGTLV